MKGNKMKLSKVLKFFSILTILFVINNFLYAENTDEYLRRFTALEIQNNRKNKNDTLVRIKGFGDGNKVLIEILNGKLKREKGYINLKGFKEINSEISKKYIGTIWNTMVTHGSNWIDAEPEDIDMSQFSLEYGIVLFSPTLIEFNDFDYRFLESLNLILIKQKIKLDDEITKYDCERESSQTFLYYFIDEALGLLGKSGIPKDYLFCENSFWNTTEHN